MADPHVIDRRAFTPADHADLQRLIAEIQEELRAQAGQGASIYRTGERLLTVQQRRLYEIEGVTWAQWTAQDYGFGERQAGKYLNVARQLTEAEARDSGLGLEALGELALAHAGLRSTLKRLLQEEGLPLAAVGRGRLAAMELLHRGGAVAAACAEAERVARPEGPAAGGSGSRDRSLCRQAELLEQGLRGFQRRMGQIARRIEGGEAAPLQLRTLLQRLAEVTEQARLLGDRIGPAPEVDFRPPAEATPDPAGTPAERAAAACETFAPLVEALSQAGALHDFTAHVLRSVALQPDARLLPRWLRQLQKRLSRTSAVPQELYEQWEQAVLAEGPDRGFLALETYRRAELPAYQQTLRILRTAPLGKALQEHVRESLAREGGGP